MNGSSFLSLDLEPWHTSEAEFKPENIYYELSKPYRLWYEYLRLSPTYWLAHKHMTGYKGGLTEDETKKLPLDFDDVIKTYADFGDVYSQTFRMWWGNASTLIFFEPNKPTKVDLVSRFLYRTNQCRENCIVDVQTYFSTDLIKFNAAHDFLLVSIPLLGKKSDLKKQVEKFVEENCSERNNPPPDKPLDGSPRKRYALHGERFRLKASTIGLRLLWIKAQYRNLESWQIGALTDISKIHKFPNIHIKPKDDKEYQSRISLGSLTNRKIKSSIVVMENAARGKFSCNDEVEIPEINYQYMWQNIRRRMQANENDFKKMKILISNRPDLKAQYNYHDILQNDDI